MQTRPDNGFLAGDGREEKATPQDVLKEACPPVGMIRGQCKGHLGRKKGPRWLRLRRDYLPTRQECAWAAPTGLGFTGEKERGCKHTVAMALCQDEAPWTFNGCLRLLQKLLSRSSLEPLLDELLFIYKQMGGEEIW